MESLPHQQVAGVEKPNLEPAAANGYGWAGEQLSFMAVKAPNERLPLVCFEDEHLLVINKPAGLNTHAPSPFAGEGVYDWLRHREPRWAKLAIIHRLDKETSGLLVFGKTPKANRSLTRQFTARSVRKKYWLITDRGVHREQFTVASNLVRAGERYVSSQHVSGERAETHFRVLERSEGKTVLEAEPLTGRTHQIRVHAAEGGLPILGDTLYGGTPAERVCLHAAGLTFEHPATGRLMEFQAPADFESDPRAQLRAALLVPEQTDAFRLVHGASDGWPGWYVTQLGPYLLSQSEQDELSEAQRAWLAERLASSRGAYHQKLMRHVRQASPREASPALAFGEAAPERFMIRENGLRFELSFAEGYSVGLFFDQRDNRRRFLVNHVAADFPLFDGSAEGKELLNTFAYTCGFSVAAAQAGMRATSIDLSKKYLEWGKRNFALNEISVAGNEFIYGDVFDWFRRWTRRKRVFDAIVLDPPTFSQSRESGVFSSEKDFSKLVAASLPLLKPQGVLLASNNAARLQPLAFVEQVESSVIASGRKIIARHYAPQPPDFPVSRDDPAYLKTLWLRVL